MVVATETQRREANSRYIPEADRVDGGRRGEKKDSGETPRFLA